MLAPHPVIGLVHEDAGEAPLGELEGQQQHANDLHEPERQLRQNARAYLQTRQLSLLLKPIDPKTAHSANRSFFALCPNRSEDGSLGQP